MYRELDHGLYQRYCMEEEVADGVTEVDLQSKLSPVGCQLVEYW